MKNDIYICYSYYHLLITMIKALKSKNNVSLIISSNNFNTDTLFNNKDLIKRLESEKIFKEIILFDHSNEWKDISNQKLSVLKKYLFLRKLSNKYKDFFTNYDNIYLYNDTPLIGRIINMNRCYYHLVEDGTDCFKNNKNFIKGNISLKNFIKKYIFNMPNMGDSKYIIDIEVNNKENITRKNIIEKHKTNLFNSLTTEETIIINKVFLVDKYFNNPDNYNNYDLIITQPLYEDNILESEEKKLELYKDIINKYCEKKKVIVKTHPRENTDYSKIINKNQIISSDFPVELLNLMNNIRFNKVITVSSTSINLINNCNEKIILGWDYLEKYK